MEQSLAGQKAKNNQKASAFYINQVVKDANDANTSYVDQEVKDTDKTINVSHANKEIKNTDEERLARASCARPKVNNDDITEL